MTSLERRISTDSILGAVLLSASLSAAPVMAQTEAPPTASVNAKFHTLDANHDGFLSRSEVRAIRDYAKAFSEADANADNRLDQDEFIKAESLHDRMVAGQFVEDSVLTAKVKAALIKELKLRAADVSVETDHGRVLLSGFVDDARQLNRAVQVASAVSGVASVRNGMTVR